MSIDTITIIPTKGAPVTVVLLTNAEESAHYTWSIYEAREEFWAYDDITAQAYDKFSEEDQKIWLWEDKTEYSEEDLRILRAWLGDEEE